MQYELCTAVVALLLGGISTFALICSPLRGKRGPYPPGPKPKWFFGNMFDFPTTNLSEVYVAWGKKYNSDILHGSLLGNHVVILNKWEDAEELLERRGAIYSDRPILPLTKLMGWDKIFALYQNGDDWLRHRVVCKKNFGRDAIKNYHPILLRKVHDLLLALLETPNDFFDHSQMLSISVPMMAMYGYDVKSIDDPCIAASNNAVLIGGRLLFPGASFISIFPFLRHIPPWFPGAVSMKLAEQTRKHSEEALRIPMEFVEKCMAEGTASPSLVSDFLEKKHTVGATEEEERIITNVAFTIYAGSSDTTMSSSETFFYLMAVNPEVQRRAQEEIDRVVGSQRLPDFEDRDSLPYIEAVYREVMRWNPPLPMAGPHRVSEDDWYKGYFIPKGTHDYFDKLMVVPAFVKYTLMRIAYSSCVTNRAMTHNEEIYPEPAVFRPERHLKDDGTAPDFSQVYGFGRRVCPGKYIANSTMWLMIASVLACFNVGKAKDEHGQDIEIDHDYINLGLTSRKKKFQCSIEPRTSTAQLLLN